MKGLDTSALLEILEGTPLAKKELRRLRGQELATTEGNFLELTCLAARGSKRVQQARQEALARLRRRLTVLPLEGRGSEQAVRRVSAEGVDLPPLLLGSLGAFEAAGCEELLTGDPSGIRGKWSFRTRKFGSPTR